VGLRHGRRGGDARRALKAFSVRKEAKDHGGGGALPGRSTGRQGGGDEDTVTRGTSWLEAARAVREAGADPILLVAVVDRGGKAARWRRPRAVVRAIPHRPDLGFTTSRA